ncbi:MAG: WhiB family transcriptional regulator [Actinomycetota bacterium]
MPGHRHGPAGPSRAQRPVRSLGGAPQLRSTAAGLLPCSSNPQLFFAEHPDDLQRARALCGSCPSRLACLDGALQRAEPWGVWGGELFLSGAIIPDKRPRGRPRKVTAAA